MKLFSGMAVIGILLSLAAGNTFAGTGSSEDTSLMRTGRWQAGAGVGFLADTPDGTAFATNLNADYFLADSWSVGPLAQLAFTDDLAQYGFSGQAKYWFPAWDAAGRTRAYMQAGVGFVHADFQRDDTSWLVPLGVGLQHTLANGVGLYGAFLLNFTDLNTGRGTDADLMPGVTFGIQF